MNIFKYKKDVGLLVLVTCFFTYPSHAAEVDKTQWDNQVLGFDKGVPEGEGFLGDMLGVRRDLSDSGFNFRLAYMTESAYNISGGFNKDKHLAFVDDTAFTFSQDLERYTGIPDAKIDGNIVNRNHDDDLTGERLVNPAVIRNDQAQEAYSGGQSTTRLGWLTFSRSFMDRRLNWRVGLINKVQDFDLDQPCDFVLISQCGGKSAHSRLWVNWNVHTWGTAFQYSITPEVTLKTGVFEYNPSAADRSHAWSWSTQGSKGVLLPLEIQWRTQSVNGLPGSYNLGALYTNGARQDLNKGKSSGNGYTDPAGYRDVTDTYYIYAGINQQLTTFNGEMSRGISFANSFGMGDERTMYFKYINTSALRFRGLMDSRPEDMFAVGMTFIKTSSHYRSNQAYRNEVNNVSSDSASWAPVPGDSINYSLLYRLQATPWLIVQPELQYWVHPSGLSDTQNAFVGALKTVITF